MMKKLLIVGVVIGGCLVAYSYLTNQSNEFIPDITTAEVTVGNIVDAVGATGTLEAVTTVQVGSQVSGIIQELNVDFNSIVRAGDVIMRLDPALFESQTEQARANLLRAEADVERLRVTVDDAATQLKRSEDLSSRELIAVTELEAAQVALRSAEAQIKSAEAQVVQAQATLNQNELSLEHTVIRSPIDGIITARLVDIGQTVAASFQAPELFVIAADLTDMRVIANIDESDVGRIRPNQRVTFAVDAFPGDEFEGTVSQVRLEPVVQQNVVTYATVIDAPNSELKLKPGMTATVSIEIARRDGATRIPTAALRFRPTREMFSALNQALPPNWQQTTSEHSQEVSRGRPDGSSDRPSVPDEVPADSPERRQQMRDRLQSMSPDEREAFIGRMRERRANAGQQNGRAATTRPSQRPRTPATETIPAVDRGASTIDALFAPIKVIETTGQVWLLSNDVLTPISITLGASDGTSSELVTDQTTGRALINGSILVTNITTPATSPVRTTGGNTSPLIPQFPFGRRPSNNSRNPR
jgi:HlyD family secretion protein